MAFKIRTSIQQNMLYIIPVTFLLLFPCTFADQVVTSIEDPPVCDSKCGCDGYYKYDEVKDLCVINLPKLMKRVLVHYDNQNDDYIMASQDGMAKSIYIESQKIFRGIMISVLLFIACAALCVISACIYCCRINYSDRKLKHEVKVLAKKMNMNVSSMKPPPRPKKPEPKSESCNVVIEEAGVFVV